VGVIPTRRRARRPVEREGQIAYPDYAGSNVATVGIHLEPSMIAVACFKGEDTGPSPWSATGVPFDPGELFSMNIVQEAPTSVHSPPAHSRHSVLAYVRHRGHYRPHRVPLSEMARRAGIAPEFLAGAIWAATELSRGDVPAHEDAYASPQTGWPSVVAKHGSD
jgi:hypothetical protein